jgi:AraC-like DNA-binding protein
MARRSTTALILLAEGFRRFGEDIDPVLRRFGLDPAHLDPSALIDQELELRINVAIAERLRDPLAGLSAGAQLGLGTYGPFTLLLLTSADAAASMHTAIRFQQLSFLFGQLGFEPGRQQSALTLMPAALPPPAHRFRVDLEVAGSWKLACDINRAAQADAVPCAIEMPYPRPAEAAAYERVFGCAVGWDAPAARLVWDNASLHRRFATADPGVHALLRAQCERQIMALETSDSALAPRVRAHIAAHISALPGAADTASALGLSERSLRRKLQAEGANYRSLLEQVRLEKSRELLADARLPVEKIAQRLGYSEPAAFIHAFKRWTGASPAAFRRAATGRSVPV